MFIYSSFYWRPDRDFPTLTDPWRRVSYLEKKTGKKHLRDYIKIEIISPPCKLRNILIRSNRIRRAVLACPKNGKVCSGFSLAWKPLEKSARIEMRRLRWERIWKISSLDGGDLFFSIECNTTIFHVICVKNTPKHLK